jgi:hypothetical protein
VKLMDWLPGGIQVAAKEYFSAAEGGAALSSGSGGCDASPLVRGRFWRCARCLREGWAAGHSPVRMGPGGPLPAQALGGFPFCVWLVVNGLPLSVPMCY